MLTRIKIYRKKDKHSGMVDIPADYFTNLISDKNNFQTGKNWLISNNIIECDEKYSKDGGKAKGYRFSNQFISTIDKAEVTKPTLFKRITKKINELNGEIQEQFETSKSYFLNTLKIDYAKAINYLDKQLFVELTNVSDISKRLEIINRYNYYYLSVYSINDGHLFFKKNKTNGRIDTNLTSLKKELKQFIAIPNLYQIDIVNSQPLFLFFLIKKFMAGLKHNPNISTIYSYLCSRNFTLELDKYLNWCRFGQFYENLKNEFNLTTKRTIDRDKVKTMTYTILFSPNDAAYAKEANNVFKLIFPGIYRFIYDYKKDGHNRLAIDLQKLESSMCIDVIVPLLSAKGIKHYTIHDAWLMDGLDRYHAEQIIKEAFFKEYGVEPKLYPTRIT